MSNDGWLETPQEWQAIPPDRTPKRGFASPLKDRLNAIVKAGAAGKPFLLRQKPLKDEKRLRALASNYRKQYGKAGFTFHVAPMPQVSEDKLAEGEKNDDVGLWTVWTPPQGTSATEGWNASLARGLNLEPETDASGAIVN